MSIMVIYRAKRLLRTFKLNYPVKAGQRLRLVTTKLGSS
jgi:hypothetical protein